MNAEGPCYPYTRQGKEPREAYPLNPLGAAGPRAGRPNHGNPSDDPDRLGRVPDGIGRPDNPTNVGADGAGATRRRFRSPRTALPCFHAQATRRKAPQGRSRQAPRRSAGAHAANPAEAAQGPTASALQKSESLVPVSGKVLCLNEPLNFARQQERRHRCWILSHRAA